ncbi:MAG TPA: DMT family transporter [Thermoplasmata archaeon]|nr:DMT family transporter [Thermoplasmata archaeon]
MATAAPTPAPALRLEGPDVALLVGLSVLWGAAYIFIANGIRLGAAPLLFASVRYGLSAAGFGLLAALRRDVLPARRALAVSAAVGGLLVIGLYGGLLYWGEQYTTGGYAAVLSSTAPILTVAFALAFLPAERLAPLALGGIALGFAGAVVLVLPDLTAGAGGAGYGPLFVLGAYVSAAAGTVLLRRYGRGPQGLWQIGSQFAVASLLLGVATAFVPGGEALPLSAGVLANLAALVAFSSLMGYFVYFRLHHRVGPVRANIVTYLVPLVGLGIGTGIFAEPVSLNEIVGLVIVIVGVTLVVRESSRRPRGAS